MKLRLADKAGNFIIQMKFLLTLSLRNLFRQKRRNILLGSAMAFGVMILIIANSFSHGISDIMFNKIVVYVAGHANITVHEGKSSQISLFRDRERLLKVIKEKGGDDIIDIDEGLGVFMRAIGNGRAENLILVGIDTTKSITEEQKKEIDESFHMLEGRFEDLSQAKVENPVILSKEKAEILKVVKGDVIRIRFRDIHGQTQSARVTLVGIVSNDNIFMQGVMFIENSIVRQMLGYRPYESGSFLLTLKNPQKNAKLVADRIHDSLKPGPAFMAVDVSYRGRKVSSTVLPFMGNDDEKKKIITSSFKLSGGKMNDVVSTKGMMISDSLCKKLGVSVNQKITISFKPKFRNETCSFDAKINGIFKSDAYTGKDTIYMHETLFYPKFYDNLPDLTRDRNQAFIPPDNASFKSAIGNEWVLLDRSQTTEDMTKKTRAAARKRIKAATIDVNSMYESASDVLKLEGVLNLITLVAVLILFFIILIGVINTLRMTIRERTREIGTIRAIGMQRKDVRRIFILETASLTLIASAAGVVLSFIVMGLLSLIPFQASDNPMGILLVNQHLYFMPTFGGIIGNVMFILTIAVVTAFFPARHAANLSAAEALRHFE